MIFDPLIPSFNCSDEEEIVTGGLNCYGIKLANIFSTAFELETASTDLCLRFKQTWTDNMTIAGTPTTRKSKFTWFNPHADNLHEAILIWYVNESFW